MSAKHQDPEYRKNARIIRAQVKAKRARGVEVTCQRCGGEIGPEQRYDVGHKNPRGGHGLDNLGPEHFRENRRAGGRQGAAVRAAKTARQSGMLPW